MSNMSHHLREILIEEGVDPDSYFKTGDLHEILRKRYIRLGKSAGNQTWWGSIVEAKANIAIGFGVAMAANAVVLPAFGYPVTVADNLGITLVFTVISVVRQLVVRRFFNGLKWGHHKS